MFLFDAVQSVALAYRANCQPTIGVIELCLIYRIGFEGRKVQN